MSFFFFLPFAGSMSDCLVFTCPYVLRHPWLCGTVSPAAHLPSVEDIEVAVAEELREAGPGCTQGPPRSAKVQQLLHMLLGQRYCRELGESLDVPLSPARPSLDSSFEEEDSDGEAVVPLSVSQAEAAAPFAEAEGGSTVDAELLGGAGYARSKGAKRLSESDDYTLDEACDFDSAPPSPLRPITPVMTKRSRVSPLAHVGTPGSDCW